MRLHPLSPVLDLARVGPQLLVVFVLGGLSQAALLPFVLVVGGLVVGWRYLLWQRFSYVVEDGALVVESGLVNRSRRVVPLDRVQQVDVQRKLRHQATGLAVVRIDTAGGGTTAEVELDAVSLDEAERLRAVLGQRPAAPPTPAAPGAPPPVAAEPERLVLEVGYGRLALAGVTGSRLLVVFVAIGSLVGLVEDLRAGTAARAAVDVLQGEADPEAWVLGALAVLAIPVWLAVAAGASILADGGYRLTRAGDRLRVQRGLLDRREASLQVHRVQVVRIADNPLRRALGLVAISLQSAGGAGPADGVDPTVRVPLLRRTDLDALLAEVLPDAPRLPGVEPAPPAARRRAWVRHVVPALVVAVPIAVLAAPVGLAALVLPVAALGLGELAYRGLGRGEVAGHVIARRGALTRETVVVPVAKAQSTRLQRSPFQRRAGLATLLIDVAGRGRTPVLHDGDAVTLARLRVEALATRAARRDERSVRLAAAAGIREAVAEVAP